MSVVTIKHETLDRPISGGAMDRTVEARQRPRWLVAGAIVAALALAVAAFLWLAPSASTQNLAADQVTVSPVVRGTFEDFVPLRAHVTPLLTVYLDSVEGGRVEKVLVEDGAMLAKGQPIAMLSNADLQLSTLARETEVTQQLDAMRSQELALAQTQLGNQRDILSAQLAATKAKRAYEREAPLAAKGFVAGKDFADAQADYAYSQRQLEVLHTTQATDQRLQQRQLAQQRASAESLQSSLAIAHANLDALNLRAPVAGQLSGFSIQIGQSLQRGERIGQIDSPGHNKLTADVNEFYLGRVQVGQTATLSVGGKAYRTRVTKLYPQVQNGTFKADLQFLGGEPPNLQRGQTLEARLTLGDPTPAVLIPNGSFYTETGGNWVFVVAPGGRNAVKRPVRLGRRNADTIEVLDGLQPGEHVITSPYTGFADKDRLDLD